MALTPIPSTFTSLFNFSDHSSHPSPSLHYLLPGSSPSFSLHLSALSRTPIYFEALKVLSRSKCFAKSPTTAEDFVGDYETLNVSDDDGSDGDNGGREDSKKIDSSSSSSDSTSLGIREPVYEVCMFISIIYIYRILIELFIYMHHCGRCHLLYLIKVFNFIKVVEVKATGAISTRKINRRQLLKSSGE